MASDGARATQNDSARGNASAPAQGSQRRSPRSARSATVPAESPSQPWTCRPVPGTSPTAGGRWPGRSWPQERSGVCGQATRHASTRSENAAAGGRHSRAAALGDVPPLPAHLPGQAKRSSHATAQWPALRRHVTLHVEFLVVQGSGDPCAAYPALHAPGSSRAAEHRKRMRPVGPGKSSVSTHDSRTGCVSVQQAHVGPSLGRAFIA